MAAAAARKEKATLCAKHVASTCSRLGLGLGLRLGAGVGVRTWVRVRVGVGVRVG